jgi:hypothetical protein
MIVLTKFRVIVAVALFGCFGASAAVAAVNWTVTGTGEPTTIDSANCVSNSCPTLRDAINSAASGDTILFDLGLDGQAITLTMYTNCLLCHPVRPLSFLFSAQPNADDRCRNRHDARRDHRTRWDAAEFASG